MYRCSGGVRPPSTEGARRRAEESIPQNGGTEGNLGDGGAWRWLRRQLRRQVAKEKRSRGQRCKCNIGKRLRGGNIIVAARAALQRVESGGVILARPAMLVSAEGAAANVITCAPWFNRCAFARQAVFVARVPVFPNAEDKTRGQALTSHQKDQQADKQI